QPRPEIGGIVGKRQVEGHTCGFHCLESIYEAYGVSPEVALLRERLGVDKPAVAFAKDSMGSIHPDIYRVAWQDGFAAEALDLENPYFKEKLFYHLRGGRVAMALFRKRDSGILHWVILSELKGGKLQIVDSLYAKPYLKPWEAFLDEEALSVIMFSVAEERTPVKIGDFHRKGLLEMNRVRKRLKKRK
ncbi:MAG: hypothetical protein AAGB46_16490, partial [Verrucomicrobiota bacterium]